MLKDLGIKTVEALAALSDTNLTFLGGRMYREKARLYLDQATGGAAVSRVVAENETMKLELARMTASHAELADVVRELQKNSTSKRASAKD